MDLIPLSFIFLLGLFAAISSLSILWEYPKQEYRREIKSLTEFSYRLAPKMRTTSTSNALNAYRHFLKKDSLRPPIILKAEADKIYHDYKEKYPKRCKSIEELDVSEDLIYVLVLHTENASTTFTWTWEKINDFDPKRERALMTKGLRQEIKRRDNFTCQYCKRVMKEDLPGQIHIDHILPVSKGGKTTKGNLQVLCASCNLSKSDKY